MGLYSAVQNTQPHLLSLWEFFPVMKSCSKWFSPSRFSTSKDGRFGFLPWLSCVTASPRGLVAVLEESRSSNDMEQSARCDDIDRLKQERWDPLAFSARCRLCTVVRSQGTNTVLTCVSQSQQSAFLHSLSRRLIQTVLLHLPELSCWVRYSKHLLLFTDITVAL